MNFLRILLTIGFGWSLSRTLGKLVQAHSIDRVLFLNSGWGWVFWLFLGVSLLTDVVTLWYLWSPTTIRFRIAQVGVVLGLVYSYITTYIAINHLDWLREAAIARRIAQGLPVRQQAIEWITNPTVLIWSYAAIVLLSGITLLLLFWYEVRSLEAQGTRRY